MFYVRKRFDTTTRTLLRGVAGCMVPSDRAVLEERIDATWGGGGESLACLSVRTAFDLLLQSVDWPPGSEVAMTAVTIPHMAELVRRHGYVPVPVDIEIETMVTTRAALEAAWSERTKAVVFAHIFGGRADLSELASWAKDRELLVVEDCAQCFDPRYGAGGCSDVEFYSFGSIKTCACFGGGVALVRDSTLREKMSQKQKAYPKQSNTSYALKLLKYVLLTAVSGPVLYDAWVRLIQLATGDYDAVVRRLTRGFSGGELLEQIRRQPSAGLLAALADRLESYDGSVLAARSRSGAFMAGIVDWTGTHLGSAAPRHTHWLFPIVAEDPDALVQAARELGFDATMGASTLVALPGASTELTEAMAKVVYLPVYGSIPEERLQSLGALVVQVALSAPMATQHSRVEPAVPSAVT